MADKDSRYASADSPLSTLPDSLQKSPIWTQILLDATQEAHANRELCGFIVVGERSRPAWLKAVNHYHTPAEGFLISAASYFAAETQGRVVALVHSHLSGGPDTFSEYDEQRMKAYSQLIWILVKVDSCF